MESKFSNQKSDAGFGDAVFRMDLQCVTKKTGFFNFLYKYLFKLYKILKIYVNF